MTKQINKEATNINNDVLIPLIKNVTPAFTVLGLAALINEGLLSPMISKIRKRGEHRAVIDRIKMSYPEKKHKLVEEVYDVFAKTSPSVASNYLIAKTLVDQQVSHIESLSGSLDSGVQLSIPTAHEALKMEDILGGRSRGGSKGDISRVVGSAALPNFFSNKVASEEVTPQDNIPHKEESKAYIDFLTNLTKKDH